ncbi:hypothetical protein PVAP13_2NG304203 [Panicum virgatum]|uniref:Uncharacterized protein n=1 Tax=Panicum virgatum TaxID=38727 RepID=A0A8T0VHL1_PANVG|nr:hypothetical protein PVAP13_2NG304203 [Panicum virgatum]
MEPFHFFFGWKYGDGRCQCYVIHRYRGPACQSPNSLHLSSTMLELSHGSSHTAQLAPSTIPQRSCLAPSSAAAKLRRFRVAPPSRRARPPPPPPSCPLRPRAELAAVSDPPSAPSSHCAEFSHRHSPRRAPSLPQARPVASTLSSATRTSIRDDGCVSFSAAVSTNHRPWGATLSKWDGSVR